VPDWLNEQIRAGRSGRAFPANGVIRPQWWTHSLVEAQELLDDGRSTFGEVVDSLLADLLTSGEFLSFLTAETTTRLEAGDSLDEAIYAVSEEVATRMQVPQRAPRGH
jgi:hypothetical protein